MRLNDYLASIQGTEQEEKLFEIIDKYKDDIAEAQGQTAQIPVVGKIVDAIVFLAERGNVADFLDSEYAELAQGLDVSVNLEKGMFNIYPGKEMRRKIFMVLGAVVAVIALLVLVCRKCRGCK